MSDQGVNGARLNERLGQLLAALGLTFTPIALGAAVQNIIKWKGVAGWLVNYWDENVRQPLIALAHCLDDLVGITLPAYLVDYVTLGVLFFASYYRSELLTARRLIFTTTGSTRRRLSTVGAWFLAAIVAWPALLLLQIVAALFSFWLFKKDERKDYPVWQQILALAPFAFFVIAALIADGGRLLRSYWTVLFLLCLAQATLLIGLEALTERNKRLREQRQTEQSS